MTIVHDKIAEYTKTFVREVAVPSDDDLAYGSDLSCTDDLTSNMAELAADSPMAVAEAIVRRLTTPRGSVPDAPNYGIDVREFLHVGLTPATIKAMPGQIRAELRDDDRIDPASLTVDVLVSDDLKSFDFTVRGQAADEPFSLTLAVVDGDVLLKEIATGTGGAI